MLPPYRCYFHEERPAGCLRKAAYVRQSHLLVAFENQHKFRKNSSGYIWTSSPSGKLRNNIFGQNFALLPVRIPHIIFAKITIQYRFQSSPSAELHPKQIIHSIRGNLGTDICHRFLPDQLPRFLSILIRLSPIKYRSSAQESNAKRIIWSTRTPDSNK